jgi:hypothetical protein
VLTAAASCPHPPLLVPELASGAASDLDDLRAACEGALGALYAAAPRLLVLVGMADEETPTRPAAPTPVAGFARCAPRGTFANLGLDLRVELPAAARGPVDPVLDALPSRPMPVSLLVGAWLLARCPPPEGTQVRAFSVGAATDRARCAEFGARLAGAAPAVALLVLADGARRDGLGLVTAPDALADEFDATVSAALGKADGAALAGLDGTTAARVGASGWAAWQVLAGAAAGARWDGDLRHHSTPFDVGYPVATWTRADNVVA